MLGNPQAQFQFAFFLSNHFITKQDLEPFPTLKNIIERDPNAVAISYFFFSAMAGNLDSQIVLGYRHLYGLGVPKDCDTALYYYKMAADRLELELEVAPPIVENIRLSDENAINQRASQAEIMEYYRYSATKVSAAQMAVAYSYMYGIRGMEQNPDIAQELFMRAVEAGDEEGYGAIGKMYAEGVGTQPNYAKAHEYLEQGIEFDDPLSHYGMGYLYKHGYHLKQDLKKAFYHFNESATLGNAYGVYQLALMYMQGKAVPQNYKLASTYMSQSATAGLVVAMYQLGVMHSKGHGVEKSCPVAVKYFKASVERAPWTSVLDSAFKAYANGDYASSLLLHEEVAERGMEIAQANSAVLYDHGLGILELCPIDQDVSLWRHRKALKWWKWSADQGNIEGYVKVGDYYYYGMGTEPQMDKSVRMYRKAADALNAQANFNLGYMHEMGKGLPQDYYLAKRYYDSAKDIDSGAYIPVMMALGYVQDTTTSINMA